MAVELANASKSPIAGAETNTESSATQSTASPKLEQVRSAHIAGPDLSEIQRQLAENLENNLIFNASATGELLQPQRNLVTSSISAEQDRHRQEITRSERQLDQKGKQRSLAEQREAETLLRQEGIIPSNADTKNLEQAKEVIAKAQKEKELNSGIGLEKGGADQQERSEQTRELDQKIEEFEQLIPLMQNAANNSKSFAEGIKHDLDNLSWIDRTFSDLDDTLELAHQNSLSSSQEWREHANLVQQRIEYARTLSTEANQLLQSSDPSLRRDAERMIKAAKQALEISKIPDQSRAQATFAKVQKELDDTIENTQTAITVCRITQGAGVVAATALTGGAAAAAGTSFVSSAALSFAAGTAGGTAVGTIYSGTENGISLAQGSKTLDQALSDFKEQTADNAMLALKTAGILASGAGAGKLIYGGARYTAMAGAAGGSATVSSAATTLSIGARIAQGAKIGAASNAVTSGAITGYQYYSASNEFEKSIAGQNLSTQEIAQKRAEFMAEKELSKGAIAQKLLIDSATGAVGGALGAATISKIPIGTITARLASNAVEGASGTGLAAGLNTALDKKTWENGTADGLKLVAINTLKAGAVGTFIGVGIGSAFSAAGALVARFTPLKSASLRLSLPSEAISSEAQQAIVQLTKKEQEIIAKLLVSGSDPSESLSKLLGQRSALKARLNSISNSAADEFDQIAKQELKANFVEKWRNLIKALTPPSWSQIKENIAKAFSEIPERLSKLWHLAADSVISTVQKVWSGIKSIGSIFKESLAEGWNTFQSSFSIPQKIWSLCKIPFKVIGALIEKPREILAKYIIKPIVEVTKSGLKAVKEFAGLIKQGVVKGLQVFSSLGDFKSAIKTVYDNIRVAKMTFLCGDSKTAINAAKEIITLMRVVKHMKDPEAIAVELKHLAELRKTISQARLERVTSVRKQWLEKKAAMHGLVDKETATAHIRSKLGSGGSSAVASELSDNAKNKAESAATKRAEIGLDKGRRSLANYPDDKWLTAQEVDALVDSSSLLETQKAEIEALLKLRGRINVPQLKRILATDVEDISWATKAYNQEGAFDAVSNKPLDKIDSSINWLDPDSFIAESGLKNFVKFEELTPSQLTELNIILFSQQGQIKVRQLRELVEKIDGAIIDSSSAVSKVIKADPEASPGQSSTNLTGHSGQQANSSAIPDDSSEFINQLNNSPSAQNGMRRNSASTTNGAAKDTPSSRTDSEFQETTSSSSQLKRQQYDNIDDSHQWNEYEEQSYQQALKDIEASNKPFELGDGDDLDFGGSSGDWPNGGSGGGYDGPSLSGGNHSRSARASESPSNTFEQEHYDFNGTGSQSRTSSAAQNSLSSPGLAPNRATPQQQAATMKAARVAVLDAPVEVEFHPTHKPKPKVKTAPKRAEPLPSKPNVGGEPQTQLGSEQLAKANSKPGPKPEPKPEPLPTPRLQPKPKPLDAPQVLPAARLVQQKKSQQEENQERNFIASAITAATIKTIDSSSKRPEAELLEDEQHPDIAIRRGRKRDIWLAAMNSSNGSRHSKSKHNLEPGLYSLSRKDKSNQFYPAAQSDTDSNDNVEQIESALPSGRLITEYEIS